VEVAVSISKSEKYDEENLLLDRETFASKIETILGGDPCAPDALAGLFVELRQAIESGLAGINRTRETLAMGVELAYLHTRAHGAAVRLYHLSQEGQLLVQDEPLTLLDAAIERTAARTDAGSRATHPRRRTRPVS
jgi:hypothetical protein